MEFFNWEILGTYAGATFAVAIFTQLTKNIPGVNKVPTQVWSYILAVVILIAANVFTGAFNAPSAALAVINAALVSLSANGGYAAVERVKNALAGSENE